MNNFDPYKIDKNLFPLAVLSDGSFDLFSFLIRWRTKGMYNHGMVSHKPGFFVSQSTASYKEIPFSVYMKKGVRLKFVGINLTPAGKRAVYDSIEKKLGRPWYEKMYDFLAIAGQTFGIKWLQNPWKDICSEDMVRHIKAAIPHEPEETMRALAALPDHGSPEDVNEEMKKHQPIFFVVGRWQYD